MSIIKYNYQAPDLSLLNADVSGILCASPETTTTIPSIDDSTFPGTWD